MAQLASFAVGQLVDVFALVAAVAPARRLPVGERAVALLARRSSVGPDQREARALVVEAGNLPVHVAVALIAALVERPLVPPLHVVLAMTVDAPARLLPEVEARVAVDALRLQVRTGEPEPRSLVIEARDLPARFAVAGLALAVRSSLVAALAVVLEVAADARRRELLRIEVIRGGSRVTPGAARLRVLSAQLPARVPLVAEQRLLPGPRVVAALALDAVAAAVALLPVVPLVAAEALERQLLERSTRRRRCDAALVAGVAAGLLVAVEQRELRAGVVELGVLPRALVVAALALLAEAAPVPLLLVVLASRPSWTILDK